MQKLLEEFARLGRNESRNTFVGFVSENPKTKKLSLVGCRAGACHASLQYVSAYLPSSSNFKYVLSYIGCRQYPSNDYLPKYRDWIDYLVTRSVYANVFVEKDPDLILKYGFVMDPNHPADLFTSACIYSRFISEKYESSSSFSQRFNLYSDLLNEGFNEEQAFFLCHVYKKEKDKIKYFPHVAGHSIFNAEFYKDANAIRSFLNKTPKLKQANYVQTQSYGSGINLIWHTTQVKPVDFSQVVPDSFLSSATDHHIFQVHNKKKATVVVVEKMSDFVNLANKVLRIVENA